MKSSKTSKTAQHMHRTFGHVNILNLPAQVTTLPDMSGGQTHLGMTEKYVFPRNMKPTLLPRQAVTVV